MGCIKFEFIIRMEVCCMMRCKKHLNFSKNIIKCKKNSQGISDLLAFLRKILTIGFNLST